VSAGSVGRSAGISSARAVTASVPAGPLLDHLEKTLADSYRKELDQEENIWRSLPFFAAALALQLAALVAVSGNLAPLAAGRAVMFVIIMVVVIAAICALALLALSIAPSRFRYIVADPDLRDFAIRLGQVPREVWNDVEKDALAAFKNELAAQYGAATHHNRLINQRRAKLRSIAGMFMIASILGTLALVSATIGSQISR
jgi:hypothetical protein